MIAPTIPEAVIERLAALPSNQREAIIRQLPADEQQALAIALKYDHSRWLQPHQTPPPGDWRWWIILAGRGSGKTFSGSTWIIEKAKSARHKWITLVAPTREAFRKVMLEGPSGILTLSPPWFRPVWSPSTLTLTWPNGVVARTYSAEKPERLRGEQHEILWVDELAAWPNLETFEQLDMGLRLGPQPQGLITTTPKPRPLILDLALGPRVDNVRVPRTDIVVTRAKSEDNPYITPAIFKRLRESYGSSRFGRQEMDAELLERTGAELFREEHLDLYRVNGVPTLKRVVVAVDPTRANDPSDEAGIIVAGQGDDGHCYILEDNSVRMSPLGWANAAIATYHRNRADVLVYEKNRLGEKTEQTLRVIDTKVKWEAVVASDGKEIRAEPVSALMEQGKIHMVGNLKLLEDELINWSPGSGWSPNRLDAFVWAVYALMLEDRRPALVAL